MQCDDHGVFEWKPIVLKALIFPADNVDFSAVLGELEKLDCVRRIQIEGKHYGIVRNFAKYQRPKNPSYRHFNAENIPPEVASYIGIKGAATPALPKPYPSATENPPQMKEEGGSKEEEEVISRSVAVAPKPSASDDGFEDFWKSFPRRDGPNPRKPAEQKFNSLVKTGVDPKVMIAAAKQLAAEEAKRGNIGTRFIPQAITWLNQQRWSDHAAVAFAATEQETDWDAVLMMFKKSGHWSRFAGPDPDSPACRAPPELLEKYGLSGDSLRPRHQAMQ
jgi:hypothetical protein